MSDLLPRDQNFVHLHNHTEYSMLDGAARIDEMFEVAKEMGMPAIATTDHGYLFGAYEFWSKGVKHGVKPIIGLERGLTDPITELNMGQTAEKVGHLFGITRAQSDAYAAESHQRLAKAQKEGFLKGEVETAFSRDGKFVMVAVGDDDTIQVIDTKTQEIVDTLPSGPDPELFTQDAAGKTMYVANENDNTVTVIDLEKRARLGDIQVGVEPEGMTISPDGKILINTSETTNMAHFIDTTTRQIVANVLVDSRPRFAQFKRDGSELWISSEIDRKSVV